MSGLKLRKQDGLTLPQPLQPSRSFSLSPDEVWIGVHFPDICLVAHQANDKPFAVLEQQQGKIRIYAMNGRAQQQGIEAGMLASAAYALSQGLCVVIRDKAAERKQLQVYAQHLQRFTPRITLSETDTLLLEVRASLRLFSGLQGLHRKLKNALSEGHTLACAPVADAAELMARNGIGKVIHNADQLRSALGDISIANSAINEKLCLRLARCGLHSLRDVWRLPRPDLARRFGPDLVHYLDQLSAQRYVPRRVFEMPDCFNAKYDFEEETEDRDYLLYAAEILLQQASVFLRERVSLSEEISFYLIYAHQQTAAQHKFMLNVYAQQGGDSPGHFLPQLSEKLQNLQLEHLLIGIELHIKQFRPRIDSSYDLFKKNLHNSESWTVLLSLLFARLGHERVYRLSLCADFRPEKTWRKRPVHNVSTSQQHVPPHSERPTWLFKQPMAIRGGTGRAFDLLPDAERIESGWWEDQDQRREYYQAVAPSGRRCWLYRDLQAVNEQWYLHGLFA